MEQLIFVGIILLFSILEAVARKRRATQGEGEEAPLPEEPHQRRPRPQPRPVERPRAETVPRSYDDEASFDDTARGDDARLRPEPAPPEVPVPAQAPARRGSEGLIPPDVWDEIQRMARGEPPAHHPSPVPERRPPPRPVPSSSRPRPAGKLKPSRRAGAPSAQTRAAEKAPGRKPAPVPESVPTAEGTADHPVHLAREAFGTPPSLRAGKPSEKRAPGAPPVAAALRKLLMTDQGSLRQAVVLQEILGPPAGLKEM